MRQSTINKIYKKIRNKYPDIKSETQIEEIVRKQIFKRKLLIAFFLYLSALASYFLMKNLDIFLKNPQSTAYENVELILKGWYGIGSIIAVMIFAKSLHNPLTPSESRELQEKDTYEKTGHK